MNCYHFLGTKSNRISRTRSPDPTESEAEEIAEDMQRLEVEELRRVDAHEATVRDEAARRLTRNLGWERLFELIKSVT